MKTEMTLSDTLYSNSKEYMYEFYDVSMDRIKEFQEESAAGMNEAIDEAYEAMVAEAGQPKYGEVVEDGGIRGSSHLPQQTQSISDKSVSGSKPVKVNNTIA